MASCSSARFPPVLEGQWMHLIKWYEFTCKGDKFDLTTVYSKSCPYGVRSIRIVG